MLDRLQYLRWMYVTSRSKLDDALRAGVRIITLDHADAALLDEVVDHGIRGATARRPTVELVVVLVRLVRFNKRILVHVVGKVVAR
jgi:hypothetical protein